MSDIDIALDICDELVAELSTKYSGGLGRSGRAEVKPFLDRYSSFERVYHGWGHIWDGWHDLYYNKSLKGQNPREHICAKWAWLWHDVIAESVKLSADLAKFYAELYAFDQSCCRYIHNLVLKTDHDHTVGKWSDTFFEDFIRDIDLKILGSKPLVFKAYRNQIWREYKGKCSPEEFKLGSSEWAKKMLSARQLFWTPEFVGLEAQARENLSTLVA